MTSASPHDHLEAPVSEAELADDRFFRALLAGDAEQLKRVLRFNGAPFA
jgi:hypothetical protein